MIQCAPSQRSTPQWSSVLAPAVLCALLAATAVLAAPVPAPVQVTADGWISGQTPGLANPWSRFERVVSFGDSWTDTGNVYKLTNHTWPLPPPLYDNGRFSNGPVWAEYLAHFVATNPRAPKTVRVYAFGGASTDNAIAQGYTGPKSDIPVPSVTDQVAKYVNDRKNNKDIKYGRTLYTIWAGGNDLFFASGPVSTDAIASNIVRAVQTIDQIHDADAEGTLAETDLSAVGDHQVVVMGLPNLKQLPYFADKPASIVAQFQAWGEAINAALDTKLAQYKATRQGRGRRTAATYVATAPVIDSMLTDPATYGLPPTQNGATAAQPCLTPKGDSFTMCPDTQSRVFWDPFHFATRTHRVLARTIAAAVGKVVPSMVDHSLFGNIDGFTGKANVACPDSAVGQA
ncbi:hypothetical protein GGF31_008869 [Allomyces arbusculus]|nr:hypothetical protein GGF31_008869 [Allomyces arbusculus]